MYNQSIALCGNRSRPNNHTVAILVGTPIAELVALAYLSPRKLAIHLPLRAFDCTLVLHVAHVEL